MIPDVLLKLLIVAVPQLAPFAPLLRIAPKVVAMVVKEAPNVGGVLNAAKEKAPHLVAPLKLLAQHVGGDGNSVKHQEIAAKALFTPHDLTIAEMDHWTENLNKHRG